jgi:hypothetical protein
LKTDPAEPRGFCDIPGANSAVLKLDIGAGAKRFYRIRVSDNPFAF